MKKFLNKHRVLLSILAIPYFTIVILSLIHVKYDVTCPGTINSIEDVFSIEDESNLDGSINVVSVYSYDKVNLLAYLLAKINPYVEVSKTYEYNNLSYDEAYQGGVIQKKISLYNSLIAGYKMAGYDLDYQFIGYIIHTRLSYTDDKLSIGDIITHVEGHKLDNEYTLSQAITENRDKIINDSNHAITVTIIKNYGSTNEKTEDIVISSTEFKTEKGSSYSFGISVYPYNIPFNTNNCPNFTIKWENITSIGPSGGLLQSFYIYEKLSGAKLTEGLKIAGTGTVDINGNAGPIGGISQKIMTAELSGVDIFFIPVSSENYANDENETNYIDAVKAYNKLKNPHMKIIPVWSLEQIIEELTVYKENKH